MTSVKRHIDAYEAALSESAIQAYFAALASIGQNTDLAFPALKSNLRQELAETAQFLLSNKTSAGIQNTQARVDAQLGKWATDVVGDLQQRTIDAKEMMLSLAGAAEGLQERDVTTIKRFGDLTERLQSIARLEDISLLRHQLAESTRDMTASVRRMEDESRAAVLKLRAQVETYRSQIADSERRALTDQLTGLQNRRGIEKALEESCARGTAFALILLDLNRFKPVNDTYGHLAGDELLKKFAAELREQFRPVDVVGRWGGDEFVVIANCTSAEVEHSVGRIRKWVFGSYKLKTPQGIVDVQVSAAVGVAVWNRQETYGDLLGRADAIMYREKQAR